MTRLIALLLSLTVQPGPSSCEVSDCIGWLVGNVPATLVDAAPADFIGHWGHSTGFGGSEFYVFADHSYIYAESSDLFPLTIYDKGRWRVARSALIMAPDSDVKWPRETDRRFVLLRPQDGSTPVVLGLDRHLQILKTLLANEPDQAAAYLRAASLQRRGSLTARQTKSVRLQLMRRAWRPAFFESAK